MKGTEPEPLEIGTEVIDSDHLQGGVCREELRKPSSGRC